ncbi:unnamed protein product [Peniophora sp. CBMAI 1063]|nr:unnamed protein product [Peniophora sp. CBMAI 1063]
MLSTELLGVIEKGPLLSERVAFILQKEIKHFDNSIGKVVKDLYHDARNMDEERVKLMVEKNQESLLRAHQGSTVSGVLVNMDLRDAWVFNLGDSSVAISHMNESQAGDLPYYNTLTQLHHANTPAEYCIQVLEHPPKEEFIKNGYIFGISELTRSLGDHHFKLPAKYVRRVLGCLPPRAQFDYSGEYIKTPPYISSWADVGYVDLAKHEDVKLFLFTDGVDDIVQWLHRPADAPRTVKPAQIVAYLASTSPHAMSLAGNELGHVICDYPNSNDGNQALDVLVNLLGGADTQRLGRVVDSEWLRQLRDPDWDDTKHIYIGDTTLIVCQFTW